jgi:hypothetical protein
MRAHEENNSSTMSCLIDVRRLNSVEIVMLVGDGMREVVRAYSGLLPMLSTIQPSSLTKSSIPKPVATGEMR